MRTFKPKLEQAPFSPSNFLSSQTEGKETFSLNRDLLLFNVLIDREKVTLFLNEDQHIEDCIPKIIDYLEWLADCKAELIACYNAEMTHTPARLQMKSGTILWKFILPACMWARTEPYMPRLHRRHLCC